MDILHSLGQGFFVAFQLNHLIFCAIGVLIGTLVGVLPGIGPTGAMALLLPITFRIDPASSLIMLCGIWYGCQYGGSTTSILVNIPGEASSVVSCIDGYQMARKGKAGPALGIAAWGSFIAGTISIIGLMMVAAPLARAALSFGAPEYFAVVCAAMMIVTYLAQGSILKALIMVLLGFFLSTIGLDMFTGLPRFTFGVDGLEDSISMAAMAMGLFGVSEVLENIEDFATREVYTKRISHLYPSYADWMASKFAILRGSIIGFFLGVLPGGGATVSSFVSYAVEKKVSKHPEEFGKGAIQGVAGPESANNGATGGSLIPLLSLGLPANVSMAMLYSALIVQGIRPGPFFISSHPDLFWGLIASMYIGNILLLILNLPLIGLWVQVLKIPPKMLLPLILLFCVIGAYSIDNRAFDLHVMIFFGVLGYVGKKFGYEMAPLLLAYVLGPLLENSLRQALLMSRGSFLIFFSRPISGTIMAIALLVLLSNLVPFFKKRREQYETFKE